MQCDFYVVLLNTMQQEYFEAGILSSRNTVKHTSTTQYEYSVAGKISSQISLQHEYYAAQTLCSMNTFSQLTRYSPAARATWHQPGCVGVQSTDGKGTSLIQGTQFIQVLCDLHKIGWNMLVTKYYRLVSCLNQSGTFGGTKVFAPRHHSHGFWNTMASLA